MSFVVVTGVKELDSVLSQLSGPAARRVSKAALNVVLRFLAAEAKKDAPRGRKRQKREDRGLFEKAPRLLRDSIRPRMVQENGNVVGGKVSLGAPHGHLVTLGTKARFRKRIGGRFASRNNKGPFPTGVHPANPFFRRAMESNMPRAAQMLTNQVRDRLMSEVLKLAAGKK